MNDHTNDDFDDLDRAIFALPLATPPPDLRAAILRATIDAPLGTLPAIVIFSRAEILAIGSVLAFAAWLVLAAVADRHFAVALDDGASALVRSLTDPTTLAWTTTGGGIAALLSLANLRPGRGARKS